MIHHTVFFKLKHAPGSPAEAQFLQRAMALARIPDAGQFECVRQVGTKNDFAWGLLMAFADSAAHERYNRHADHVSFVAGHWVPEVESFIEIDYVSQG